MVIISKTSVALKTLPLERGNIIVLVEKENSVCEDQL